MWLSGVRVLLIISPWWLLLSQTLMAAFRCLLHLAV